MTERWIGQKLYPLASGPLTLETPNPSLTGDEGGVASESHSENISLCIKHFFLSFLWLLDIHDNKDPKLKEAPAILT